MDGRFALYLSCALLLTTAGCQSSKIPAINQGTNQPSGTPAAQTSARPRLPLMSPYQSARNNEDTGEKKQLKPSTLVAAGDFYARAAMAPERPANEREAGLDQARRAYAQALQNDPNYLPAQIGMARALVNLNDMERARTAYERALQIAPNNAVVWHDLGIVYLRLKNWDTALPALEKAVGLDGENRQYQNTYGWALARAGRTDEALTCFARLHGDAQAHYKLARMLNHMQQAEPSRKHLELALRKDPNLKDAREMLVAMEAPPGTMPTQPVNAPSTPVMAQGQPNGEGLPPQVQPIRPVIFHPEPTAATPAAPTPALNLQQPQPALEVMAEPQTTLPPAPASFQLPPDIVQATPRAEVQPVEGAAEPIRLLPRPPRVR